MEQITNQIYALFLEYRYAAVFIGVMLDNAGFPVPGELVLILAGGLVATGDFSFAPTVAVGALGALLSDSGWFFAGRAGSRRLMQLYCRVSFGSTACLARTERNLNRFGAPSLLYARFVPGFRTFAAPMAGMRGLPYRLFLRYDGLGALLWACLGVTTGAVFAYRIPAILNHLEDSRILLLYLAGSLLLLFLLMKWLVRQRHGRAQLTDPPIKTPKT